MKELHAKRKGGPIPKFVPEISSWRVACRVNPYDNMLCKTYDISYGTLYNFLNRERARQEEDPSYISEFLEAYKEERNSMKKKISDAYEKNVDKGDVASIIFGMKTYNGLIEAKDHKAIELKRIEVEHKSKVFLTELAKQFNLSFEQLENFAEKHFKSINLDK